MYLGHTLQGGHHGQDARNPTSIIVIHMTREKVTISKLTSEMSDTSAGVCGLPSLVTGHCSQPLCVALASIISVMTRDFVQACQ